MKYLAARLAIVLLVFAAGTAKSQSSGNNRENNKSLSVTVVAPKRSVSMSDVLTFDVILRNTGTDPLYLYRVMGWGHGGLVLGIVDLQGKPIRSPLLDDTLLPPPPIGDYRILVCLDSDEFFGVRRSTAVRDLVNRPGRYRLRVSYVSVLYPELVDPQLRGLPVIWEGHQPVRSEWIDIEVTR